MKKLMMAIAGVGVASIALAGERMKPGMYEYTMKMEMPGMPMQIPPQTSQHCLTKADIDENKQYRNDRQKDCEISNLKQSAGSASFDMACKDGTTGHADYAFSGDSMTGKSVMNMKEHGSITTNLSAKRTGDCK